EHRQLRGGQLDLGQGVRVPVDPVADLVLEPRAVRPGDQRHAQLAQVLLVPLEHPVEGLARLAVGVLRDGGPDLLLGQPATGRQQADHQVAQALGAAGGHRRSRYPSSLAGCRRRDRGGGGVILWREGRIVAPRGAWGGALEFEVDLTGGGTCLALAYPDLVGRPQPGEVVLLNTTALELGLGTGGYAIVVALPHRLPDDPPPAPGHLVQAPSPPLHAG